MAVTPFQSKTLKLLAANRHANGASYVAGGVALNLLLDAQRLSRDIDIFHDVEEAVNKSWLADREILVAAGYKVEIEREATTFIEARISLNGDQTSLQWVRDSAFRFFPLLEDPLMGLTLHPFDLATNKVLAMAGRLEVRDWIDLLNAHLRLQPLGLLLWAACGKDPGYNPVSLLAAISRHHYSQPEIDSLSFQGPPPDASKLGRQWHQALSQAKDMIDIMPVSQAGKCVLTGNKELFSADLCALRANLADQNLIFHAGSIYGAWPTLRI